MPVHIGNPEIQQISFERFVELIKDGDLIPSVEVMVGGEVRFAAIVYHRIGGTSIYDDITAHAIALAMRSNIPLDRSLHEKLNKPTPQERMAKAREALKEKRSKVNVPSV